MLTLRGPCSCSVIMKSFRNFSFLLGPSHNVESIMKSFGQHKCIDVSVQWELIPKLWDLSPWSSFSFLLAAGGIEMGKHQSSLCPSWLCRYQVNSFDVVQWLEVECIANAVIVFSPFSQDAWERIQSDVTPFYCFSEEERYVHPHESFVCQKLLQIILSSGREVQIQSQLTPGLVTLKRIETEIVIATSSALAISKVSIRILDTSP